MPDVPPGHMSTLLRQQRATSQQRGRKEDKQKTPYIAWRYPRRARHAKCHAVPNRRKNTTTGHKSNVIFWPIYLGLVKSLNNFAVRTSFRFISKSNFRLFLKIFTRSLPGPREFAFLRPEWPRYRKFHCLLVIWFKGQRGFSWPTQIGHNGKPDDLLWYLNIHKLFTLNTIQQGFLTSRGSE